MKRSAWLLVNLISSVRAKNISNLYRYLLKRLFEAHLDKDYTQREYVEQFTIRIPENLARLDRIEQIYRDVPDAPPVMFETFQAQRARLEALRAAKGDYVSPLDL